MRITHTIVLTAVFVCILLLLAACELREPNAIHLMVRPYLVEPDWVQDSSSVANQFLDLVERALFVTRPHNIKLKVTIPRWYDTQQVTRNDVTQSLAKWTIELTSTVMLNYVNSTQAVISGAATEMAYGDSSRTITIAVDTAESIAEPSTTFYGQSSQAFEQMLTLVDQHYNGDPAYDGMAIFHYTPWSEMNELAQIALTAPVRDLFLWDEDYVTSDFHRGNLFKYLDQQSTNRIRRLYIMADHLLTNQHSISMLTSFVTEDCATRGIDVELFADQAEWSLAANHQQALEFVERAVNFTLTIREMLNSDPVQSSTTGQTSPSGMPTSETTFLPELSPVTTASQTDSERPLDSMELSSLKVTESNEISTFEVTSSFGSVSSSVHETESVLSSSDHQESVNPSVFETHARSSGLEPPSYSSEFSEFTSTSLQQSLVEPVMCYSFEATDERVCSGNGECEYQDMCTCRHGYSGNNCEEAVIIVGTFGFSPSHGTALSTVFTIGAANWTNVARYSFGYFDEQNIKTVLQSRSNASSFSTLLPSGNLTLYVSAISMTGKEETSTAKIRVNEPVSDILSSAIDNVSTGTQLNVLASITVITNVVSENKANVSSSQLSDYYSKIVDILYMNTTALLNSAEDGNTVVTVMKQITEKSTIISSNTAERVSTVLATVMNSATVSNSSLTNVIEAAKQLEPILLQPNSTAAPKLSFHNLLSSVLSVGRKNLPSRSKAQITFKDATSEVVKEKNDVVAESSIADPKRSQQIVTRADLRQLDGPDATISMQAISYKYSIYDTTEFSSSIVSVRVYLNDEEITSAMPSNEPLITVELPVDSSLTTNRTYVCRFWDSANQLWKNDTAVCSYSFDEQKNIVSCQCSQSATIGATLDYVQAITDEEDIAVTDRSKKLAPGTIAIIVIVIVTVSILVAVLLAVFIGIAAVRLRKRKSSLPDHEMVEPAIQTNRNGYAIWYTLNDLKNRILN